MSLNKEKVNEILTDMKEEERKKQESIEAEVDKFLEDRLEYYVAMVLNGEAKTPEDMLGRLIDDGCINYDVAMEVIDKSLAEYDWYRCMVFGAFEYHIIYMSIYNSSTDGDQFGHVKERQVELGLRKPEIRKGRIESIEVERASHKTSGRNIIVISIVIVVALILVAIACTH